MSLRDERSGVNPAQARIAAGRRKFRREPETLDRRRRMLPDALVLSAARLLLEPDRAIRDGDVGDVGRAERRVRALRLSPRTIRLVKVSALRSASVQNR